MVLNIYTHPIGLKHDTGPGHAESPERLRVIMELLDEMGITPATAPEAEVEWIARAHPQSYIDSIVEALPDRGTVYLDSDTVISPQSYEAALHGAGAVCKAVEDVLSGKTQRAYCAIRPPGHHAEPERAMGFCLFNNVMIGALHAQAHGLKRIAIVDFDVHHGNGTDVMARKHENIFFISSHQWPLYPGTGGPDDQLPGRVTNIPLPAGTGSAAFRKIYKDQVFPALLHFEPDLLMISAGFDAHKDDPLAQMDLDEDDFSWVTSRLVDVAKQCCGGKIVSVQEGGYNLAALKTSVRAHIEALQNA